MKQLSGYISRKQGIFLLAILGVISILFVRTRIFTISKLELDEAASTYNVTFEDQGYSFNIIPSGNQSLFSGIIFYPGALVDAKTYAPKLAAIASAKGIKVFIVKPYLRLADLNPGAANNIIKANPAIKAWYIGGHSMGGGAACSFSRHHPSLVQGLFLFAAYCAPGDRQFSGPTLAFVGTNDSLEPASKIQSRIPARSTIIKIEGANHASFGNYGSQPFDGKRTISEADMIKALTEALQRFIN